LVSNIVIFYSLGRKNLTPSTSMDKRRPTCAVSRCGVTSLTHWTPNGCERQMTPRSANGCAI